MGAYKQYVKGFGNVGNSVTPYNYNIYLYLLEITDFASLREAENSKHDKMTTFFIKMPY